MTASKTKGRGDVNKVDRQTETDRQLSERQNRIGKQTSKQTNPPNDQKTEEQNVNN